MWPTGEQIITVEGDAEVPVLANVPADITVECSNLPPLVDPVTATDNCDLNVNIAYSENTIPGNCPDTYTIEREWLATDMCGNSSFRRQLILVEDNTPPVMTNVPIDLNINCGQVPPIAPIVFANR